MLLHIDQRRRLTAISVDQAQPRHHTALLTIVTDNNHLDLHTDMLRNSSEIKILEDQAHGKEVLVMNSHARAPKSQTSTKDVDEQKQTRSSQIVVTGIVTGGKVNMNKSLLELVGQGVPTSRAESIRIQLFTINNDYGPNIMTTASCWRNLH